MMLDQRILCVITGASRGYGRTLAQVFAEIAAPSSVFVLLARDAAGLGETRSLVLSSNAEVTVHCHSVDLASAECAELGALLSPLAAGDGAQFDVGLLLHNAGSPGNTDLRASSLVDRSALLDYFALNLVSPMVLTGAYMQHLRGLARRHVVVNVSSLLAVQAMPSLSMYATGKAARDMFFRSLATEEAKDKDGQVQAPVRVLNWAPGPMETRVRQEGHQHSFDAEVRERLGPDGESLPPEESARKLCAVLIYNQFQSGQHLSLREV